MTQYKSFLTDKKKLNYITEQTVEIDYNLQNIQKEAQFRSTPATEFYKNAQLIYESDWINSEVEKITEAVSITKDTLLPERAKYAFSIRLNITDDFFPYLKIEIQAKTNPDIILKGVFPFISTMYHPIQFHLYNWQGITYSSPCWANPAIMPQPDELYTHSGGGCPCGFKYPPYHYPVPIGSNKTFELPRKDLIGYENRYSPVFDCSGTQVEGSQYWDDAGIVEFETLLEDYTLEQAEELITDNYDNVIFSEESSPRQALEFVETEQVVTGNQMKKFLRQTDTDFIVEVSGDFLLISPATEETSWSNSFYPTYQPHGGDLQVKLCIYSINPNFYSEKKFYTK